MKKNTILLFLILATTVVAVGQNTNNLLGYSNGKPVAVNQYIKCSKFSISKPLRELAKEAAKSRAIGPEREEVPTQVGKGQNNNHPPKLNPPDPVLQRRAGILSLDTPRVNVEAGNWAYRPDLSCAAGPNNVVQGYNLGSYNIYDKLGNLILTTDIGTIAAVSVSDDPVVMYDKFADRWILTGVTQNYNSLTVAVSATGDPLGSYYCYTYNFGVMPDFPKYSVWVDGYYSTYRDINLDTVGLAVFDRTRMLKGDVTAGIIYTKFPNAKVINKNSQLPASPKILTCDGFLPPFGTPAYLMYYTNVNMGDPSNSIMIYKLVTDTTNKTCALSFVDSLATAPYDGYFAGYAFGGNIQEPGGASAWSLEGPLQYRVPYIRFTGYSSVVLCNEVNLGDSIGGIRWYELRQNDTTLKWSIHQQATYGPNDSISRWNASICMDLNGDISLAYNVTNKYSLYPGIRYTGRLVSDPMGQMTFAEQTARMGTYPFNTQWGDYSCSSLDPDGVTFWHVNQYIIDPTGNTANTRLFSFRLAAPAGVSSAMQSMAELKAYQSGNSLNVIASDLPNNDKTVVNLFDISGRQLYSDWVVPQANRIETKINVSSFATGAYFVRIGNINYQKVVKVIIN